MPVRPGPTGNPLLAEAKRLRAKKRFSQNFLIDPAVVARIADAAALTPGETVLEIGPGSGVLTRELLERADHVVAVEVEDTMIAHLQGQFKEDSRFSLIREDVLKVDFDALPLPPRFKVAGNLPYSITSPILFHLIGELHQPDYPLRHRLDRIVLMVQWEVGERLAARPGSKAFNHLSIATQFWFDVNLLCKVPARAFYPAPKVDSAVVVLTPRETPAADVTDYRLLTQVIRTAFAHRRKLLKNNLLQLPQLKQRLDGRDILSTLMASVGVQSDQRPDTVSIAQYAAFANQLHTLIATLSAGEQPAG
ncbi:MAG: 16S rRNA (adenine(1518)-N(6)/adenine(1519)-N(6))-dimethyltransferase RsmA [Candidatus Melainabacteria bacterium]